MKGLKNYPLTHSHHVFGQFSNRYQSRSIVFLPQVSLSQISLPQVSLSQDRKFDWIKEGF